MKDFDQLIGPIIRRGFKQFQKAAGHEPVVEDNDEHDQLIEAVAKGEFKRVQDLLDGGVNPNLRADLLSQFPLVVASQKGFSKIVLANRDEEQIYRLNWPAWLLNKYAQEIKLIEQIE